MNPNSVLQSYEEYCRDFVSNVRRHRLDETLCDHLKQEFKDPWAINAILYLRQHFRDGYISQENKRLAEDSPKLVIDGKSDVFEAVNKLIGGGKLDCLRFITMYHALVNCEKELTTEVIRRCAFSELSDPNQACDAEVVSAISEAINLKVKLVRKDASMVGEGLTAKRKAGSHNEDEASPSKKNKTDELLGGEALDMEGFPHENPVIFYKKISAEHPLHQWPKYKGRSFNRTTFSAVYDLITLQNDDTCMFLTVNDFHLLIAHSFYSS